MPKYYPFSLRDGDNFRWTFDSYGRVTYEVKEFGYSGGLYRSRMNYASSVDRSDGGRQLDYGPATYGDLKYAREVYVSKKDGFVRYLEIYKNTGDDRLQETVTVNSYMASYAADRVVTSDGNRSLSVGDEWIVRRGDAAGERPVAFVFGDGDGDAPASVVHSGSQVGYTFALDLAPGETQIVMHFVALDRSLDKAVAEAKGLAALKGDALHGLSDKEQAQIVNFEPGQRVYNGTEKADKLIGAAFEEVFRGRGGNDRIEARDGDDRIYGHAGHDRIAAGGGNDIVYGGSGRDRIAGGDGNDLIWGDGLDRQTTSAAGQTSGGRMAISLTLPDASDDTSIDASGFISRTPITSSTFNVAFVIDVSGSTSSRFQGDVEVGDRNGDGISNSILDAEIAGFEALLEGLTANVGAENLNIAVVAFESGAETVLAAHAGRDRNGDGVPDVVEALRSFRSTGSTNYKAGLEEAQSFFDGAGDGQNLVFFLSDGGNNGPSDFDRVAARLRSDEGANATIRSFGVGENASETDLDRVDDQRDNDSVEIVLDPSDLSRVLIDPRISRADIDRVELYVNGKRVQTIPGSALQPTPLGLDYTFDAEIEGLRPNAKDEVRARLVASDGTILAVRQIVETVKEGVGADRIDGGAGNDIIHGGGGNDTLKGGNGNDELYGDGGNDKLQGGDGKDLLDGGSGGDRMVGGAGDDTYFVGSAADVIVEESHGGVDRVVSSIDFSLGRTLEHLTLVGAAVRGEGNGGNNTLRGSAGDNLLRGGGGRDLLAGGDGADTLTGGDGADRFVFASTDAADADTITDFRPGQDRIVLDAATFGLSAGTPGSSFFLGSEATASYHRILYDESTGILRYDSDGTGAAAAVRIATLSGTPALTEADLLVA